MYGLPFFQTILWIKDIFYNQYIFSDPKEMYKTSVFTDTPVHLISDVIYKRTNISIVKYLWCKMCKVIWINE